MTRGVGGVLKQTWRQQLLAQPDVFLLEDASGQFTRAGFEALIEAQAAQLSIAGIQATDIVAWLGHNSARQLATLFACERLGAVFMPLNWRLTVSELLAQLLHAGTAALLFDDSCSGLASALCSAWQDQGKPVHAAAQPGDLLLVYTSGTTGEPKGAMHTAAQVAANACKAIATQGLNTETRTLAVLPMFHVGGLCIQLLPTVLSGGAVRLHARFDPGAWLADVKRWCPTTSVLVPATMRAVVEHAQWPHTPLHSLAFIYTGSSVVPVALIEKFHERKVPVAQVYGSTETGPFSIALQPSEAMAHAGGVGSLLPGVQARLVNDEGGDVGTGSVGELWLRGDNVMRGYHRAPDHPDFVDGWFRSGDLARLGADDRYEIVGRSKDMIISGGENIYPAEIENLVIAVQGVGDCAVIGLPDERWGETPVLCIVPAPGMALELAEVRAAYEHKLARYKHPRRLVQLPSLPKTALGKVQKSALLAAVLHLEP